MKKYLKKIINFSSIYYSISSFLRFPNSTGISLISFCERLLNIHIKKKNKKKNERVY